MPLKTKSLKRRFSRHQLLAIFIFVLVGGLGIYLLTASHAQSPYTTGEAENGTLASGPVKTTDTNASGGNYVKFGSPIVTNPKGVGLSVPSFPSLSKTDQDAWLSDMRNLGVTWIRTDIEWATVQPNNASTFNWAPYDAAVAEANAYGIKVDGIIDYSALWASSCSGNQLCAPSNPSTYATYAKAVVQHFGSKLGAVEIWNEPNITLFWGSQTNAATYTSMLKLAYTAIKSVDPTMTVISAGLSPATTGGGNTAPLDFATAMYANGAKNSFDVFGFHPYSYPAPPSDNQTWSAWSQMSQTNPSLRSIMTANGDSAKQVWMTEVGAPTGGPGAIGTCTNMNYAGQPDHVDECLQSTILSQAITISKGYSWSGITFLYSYKDDGTSQSDRENFFGILRNDGSQKPSYAAVKSAIAQ